MTKRAACKFTAGQRVEVMRYDFEVPGFPYVWKTGVVETVEPMDEKLWNVHVAVDGGGWSPQIVGPRGGNKNIRAA